MNRRAFLLRSTAACAGLSPLASASARLWAQGTGPLALPDLWFDRPARSLPAVHIDSRDILRTIVGLRPYRPSGFVVREEKLDDTLVIHNYGHGGAGITLSWGTAQLALQVGCPGHLGTVAVLGCGAVGLATARMLQESGFKVTIYTKALPPDTTSSIAGGNWSPFLVSDPAKSDASFNQQMRLATDFAYNRFQSMLGERYGIRWVQSYVVSNGSPSESLPAEMQGALRGLTPDTRDLRPDEHPFPVTGSVRLHYRLMIAPPKYLQAMQDAFHEASGTIVVREIADRAAITQLPEKLVFNCTGMGAKDIFDDQELTPVRGQLTFLKPQPEIYYAVSHDELYMLPRSEGILLGATYELGISSLTPDRKKEREILARHKAFFDNYRRA